MAHRLVLYSLKNLLDFGNREGAKNSGGKKAGLQPATGNTGTHQVDRLLVLGGCTHLLMTSENPLVRYLSGQTQRGQRRK